MDFIGVGVVCRPQNNSKPAVGNTIGISRQDTEIDVTQIGHDPANTEDAIRIVPYFGHVAHA